MWEAASVKVWCGWVGGSYMLSTLRGKWTESQRDVKKNQKNVSEKKQKKQNLVKNQKLNQGWDQLTICRSSKKWLQKLNRGETKTKY